MDRLKAFLVALTFLELGYIIACFFFEIEIFKFDYNIFDTRIVLFILHILVLTLILRKVWLSNLEKSKKSNVTFLMIFLGVIGMWLWFPKRENCNS